MTQDMSRAADAESTVLTKLALVLKDPLLKLPEVKIERQRHYTTCERRLVLELRPCTFNTRGQRGSPDGL